MRQDGAKLAVVLEVMDAKLKRWQLDFWSARDVPVLDLAPVLVGAERAGVHTRLDGDPHISAAGQALVAEALDAFIDARGAPAARRPAHAVSSAAPCARSAATP